MPPAPDLSKTKRKPLQTSMSFEPVDWLFSYKEHILPPPAPQVKRFVELFEISETSMRKIMQEFLKRMEEGLHHESHAEATVRMLPSYVPRAPSGKEEGEFVALDLGGTNFRVLTASLSPDSAPTLGGKDFVIPRRVMTGTGEALFDHIVKCICETVEERGLGGGGGRRGGVPLGFTFSFPVFQEDLAKGRLISWTKGFSASGVEGEDVVQLLKNSVKKVKNLEVDVVALVNDTTGTLMACAHKTPDCGVGVIVGTGSNACYVERVDRMSKLDHHSEEMIINTEWGGFGNDGCLDFVRTEFDREMDANSINPKQQLFEKMISGMYLGEIVRLVLLQMTVEGILFDGHIPDDLETPGSFPTKFLSEIETDLEVEEGGELDFQRTFDILEELNVPFITPADCLNVAHLCSAVSRRAAVLCGCGITTLLNRMGKPMVTVGVDGSVYKFHPTFKKHLENNIRHLIQAGLRFQVVLSEDGSGIGAALTAAVASQEVRNKEHKPRKLLRQTPIDCQDL